MFSTKNLLKQPFDTESDDIITFFQSLRVGWFSPYILKGAMCKISLKCKFHKLPLIVIKERHLNNLNKWLKKSVIIM